MTIAVSQIILILASSELLFRLHFFFVKCMENQIDKKNKLNLDFKTNVILHYKCWPKSKFLLYRPKAETAKKFEKMMCAACGGRLWD